MHAAPGMCASLPQTPPLEHRPLQYGQSTDVHSWLPSGMHPQYGGKSPMGAQVPPGSQVPPQLNGPPPHGVGGGMESLNAGTHSSKAFFGARVFAPKSSVFVRTVGGVSLVAGFAL